MVNFKEDHKRELASFFPEGIHKVKITSVELGKTQDEKEYMEFGLAQGMYEDKARVWFTTDKAIGYSFNVIRGIFVHNAGADKKDKAREAFDKIESTEDLEKVCQGLIGKECWFSVFEDPNRTYQNSAGETRNSLNKNIYGYEPTVRLAKPTNVPVSTESSDEPFKGDGSEFGF